MDRIARLDDRTAIIDLAFQGRRQTVASFVLLGEPPALIETGPSSCLPSLEAGLAELDLGVQDLGALVLTHIHLDHAGATGSLVRRNPRLRVFVHRVGAPHLADPSRLLRSARRIYGDGMDALWGEVAPVPADRITALDDGDAIDAGGRPLRVVETLGHAKHHHALADEAAGTVFAGDAAGVALPGCAYVRPPTPPPELDLEAWDRSLDRIAALRPRRLCLTHFGARDDPEAVLGQMRRRLRDYADALRPGWEAAEDLDRLVERLRARVQPELERTCGREAAERYELGASVRMNVQGYVRYFETRDGSGR